MFRTLKKIYGPVGNFTRANKAELAIIGTVVSAFASAISSYHSATAAASTDRAARRTISVASLKDWTADTRKLPNIGRCLQAIAKTSQRDEAVRMLLTGQGFSLVLNQQTAAPEIAGVKNCLAMANLNVQPSISSVDNTQTFSIDSVGSNTLRRHTLELLQTYNQVLLPWHYDLGDKALICLELMSAFDDNIYRFIGSVERIKPNDEVATGLYNSISAAVAFRNSREYRKSCAVEPWYSSVKIW